MTTFRYGLSSGGRARRVDAEPRLALALVAAGAMRSAGKFKQRPPVLTQVGAEERVLSVTARAQVNSSAFGWVVSQPGYPGETSAVGR